MQHVMQSFNELNPSPQRINVFTTNVSFPDHADRILTNIIFLTTIYIIYPIFLSSSYIIKTHVLYNCNIFNRYDFSVIYCRILYNFVIRFLQFPCILILFVLFNVICVIGGHFIVKLSQHALSAHAHVRVHKLL